MIVVWPDMNISCFRRHLWIGATAVSDHLFSQLIIYIKTLCAFIDVFILHLLMTLVTETPCLRHQLYIYLCISSLPLST